MENNINIARQFVEVEKLSKDNLVKKLKDELYKFRLEDCTMATFKEINTSKEIKLTDFKYLLNLDDGKYEGICSLYIKINYNHNDESIYIQRQLINDFTKDKICGYGIPLKPERYENKTNKEKWLITMTILDIYEYLVDFYNQLTLFKKKNLIKKIK